MLNIDKYDYNDSIIQLREELIKKAILKYQVRIEIKNGGKFNLELIGHQCLEAKKFIKDNLKEIIHSEFPDTWEDLIDMIENKGQV